MWRYCEFEDSPRLLTNWKQNKKHLYLTAIPNEFAIHCDMRLEILKTSNLSHVTVDTAIGNRFSSTSRSPPSCCARFCGRCPHDHSRYRNALVSRFRNSLYPISASDEFRNRKDTSQLIDPRVVSFPKFASGADIETVANFGNTTRAT